MGAALANSDYDRGGLELRLWRLGADGKTTSVQQNRAPNGDRIITAVVPPGRYVVHAATGDQQVHPGTNLMDVTTVRGREGRYGVRLTGSAPAPVVTSFTTSSSTVRRTSADLRVTLTAWAMTGPTRSVVLAVRR